MTGPDRSKCRAVNQTAGVVEYPFRREGQGLVLCRKPFICDIDRSGSYSTTAVSPFITYCEFGSSARFHYPL